LLAELARVPDAEVDEAWSRPPSVGDVLGRYELIREIGRGGFGIVYAARDRELGRFVALKVLRPATRARALLASEWIQREADAAAQLNHPAIATLHDVGRWAGGPFLVFELLEGQTLEDRLQRGRISVREAVFIGLEIASGLAAAHAAGVVHRDLKPANVFLTADGRVKLLDFGLARVVGGAVTPAGGTPPFMAPEVWRGEEGDARTDVFAAGVLIHEMLTGDLPYPVTNGRPAVLDAGPAPAPRARGVPTRLARTVQRAIARDPAQRLRDGRALAQELIAVERLLERRPRTRRGLVVASIVAAVVTGVLARVLAPKAPPPEAQRVGLVVADAQNETGERALDSLAGLLVTSLEQSRHVRVVTRSRMFDLLRQAGRPDVPRIGPAEARSLAARAEAHAVVVLTVRHFDDVYALDVEALDPSSDERLFALQERGSGLAVVPAMVDRLSARVREAVQEREEEIRESRVELQRAVTANLDAYRHFYEGRDCLDRPSRGPSWNQFDCAGHFERALAADPEFALAHFELARLKETDGAPASEQRAALAPALRGLERLPAKERDLVLAWKAHVDGQDEEAMAIYRRAATAFPDDKDIAFRAGDLEYHRGHAREAVPWMERVLALDPEYEYALDHVVTALGVIDDEAQLDAVAERLSAGPRTPAILHALSTARAWQGKLDAAFEAAGLEEETGTHAARGDLFNLHVFAGHLDRAEAMAREDLTAASRATEPRVRARLAGVLVAQGRWREAIRELDAAAASAETDNERAIVYRRRAHLLAGRRDGEGIWAQVQALASMDLPRATLAIHLAYAGDLAHADALGHGLDGLNAAAYTAIVDWRRGAPERAASELQLVATRCISDGLVLPLEAPWFLAAEALADAGRHEEALVALRRFQRLYAVNFWRSWAFPRSRLLVARSLAALGRRAEATSEVDALLATLARADADDALRSEASALRRAIVETAPSRPVNR
jgi:tetratricopeptide (TPR) repeat protein